MNPFTGAAVFNLFGYHHVNKKARHILFNKLVEVHRVLLGRAETCGGSHEVGRKAELVVRITQASHERIELRTAETAGNNNRSAPCGPNRVKNILDKPIEVFELLIIRNIADIGAKRSGAATKFIKSKKTPIFHLTC